MNLTEQLKLLKELLAALRHLEELDPHFTNRRRIGEIQAAIQNFPPT